MRVLLVCADHSARDKVKVAFQQFEGAAVDTADDAWALELAKETAYDAVAVSESLAAEGDGIALLKDLRANGLGGPAVILAPQQGDLQAREREVGNVAAVLVVPPDPVETFKAVLAVQQRLASRPSR